MCFVLYIASPVVLPLVEWNADARAFNIKAVKEWHRGELGNLSLPYRYELGSRTQCGCGFRNVDWVEGSWPMEEWRPEDDTRPQEAQSDHERMVAFLRSHLPAGAVLELYGGWDGELGEACCSDQEIPLSRLLDLGFFFRHRGHYTVTVD